MDATAEQIRSVGTEAADLSDEYDELYDSDYMRLLTKTNNIRIEEELTRPRVEIWADDFEWQQWVSQHEQRRRGLICHLPSMRSSPFCPFGHH